MQFLHSMIRTQNEKEMIRFYCDFLGLKLGERIRLDDCYLQYLTDEITGSELELTINDEHPENGYSQGNQFGHFRRRLPAGRRKSHLRGPRPHQHLRWDLLRHPHGL